MTQREHSLAKMRIAGYHNDQRDRVRLIVESRVNRAAMNAAWSDGVKAKAAGAKCSCFECSR